MIGKIITVRHPSRASGGTQIIGKISGPALTGSSSSGPSLGFVPFVVSNAIVVTQVGAPPVLYMSLGSRMQIAAMDCYSANMSVRAAIWRTGAIRIGDDGRAQRRRLKRVEVYGEGTIMAGSTISANFDNDPAKTQIFPLSNGGLVDAYHDIIAYQEFTPLAEGRQIDVMLTIYGTNIVLRSIIIYAPEV